MKEDFSMELPADEPPKDGTWVDTHDVLSQLTPDELADGKRLGQTIDTDDDLDTGLILDESRMDSGEDGE